MNININLDFLMVLTNNRSVESINFYIGLIILFPSFFGYLGVGAGQLIYIFFISGMGLFLLLINKINSYPPILYRILILLTCQLICYILTIISNTIDPFIGFAAKDATDLMRPIIYMIYFSVPILLQYKSTSFIKVFFICILIGILLDCVKFIPTFYPIIRLYTHLPNTSLNFARFNGTFTYCYSFGFVVLFLLAYLLNSKYRYKYISIIGVFIVIFLTGSRSILLGAFALLIFQILFFGGSVINKTKAFVFIGLLITLFYIILINLDIPIVTQILNLIQRGYDALMGEANDPSFNTRGNQIARALSNFDRNPLFGVGPQKDSEAPIENLFGYYLSSWGLFGTTCYLIIWSNFLYNAYKCTSISNFSIKIFSRANFLWLLMVPFGGMSAPITEGIRLAPLYYVIQGIQGVMYYKNKRDMRLERNSKMKINKK